MDLTDTEKRMGIAKESRKRQGKVHQCIGAKLLLDWMGKFLVDLVFL